MQEGRGPELGWPSWFLTPFQIDHDQCPRVTKQFCFQWPKRSTRCSRNQHTKVIWHTQWLTLNMSYHVRLTQKAYTQFTTVCVGLISSAFAHLKKKDGCTPFLYRCRKAARHIGRNLLRKSHTQAHAILVDWPTNHTPRKSCQPCIEDYDRSHASRMSESTIIVASISVFSSKFFRAYQVRCLKCLSLANKMIRAYHHHCLILEF